MSVVSTQTPFFPHHAKHFSQDSSFASSTPTAQANSPTSAMSYFQAYQERLENDFYSNSATSVPKSPTAKEQKEFYLACSRGDIDSVNKYLSSYPQFINRDYHNHAPVVSGTSGYSVHNPLTVACEKGHIEIVKALLSQPNIDINAKPYGDSALAIACKQGHKDTHLQIVKMLLEQGALDPNLPDRNGHTPLYLACAAGNSRLVDMLLSHPNIDTTKGDTIFQFLSNNSSPLGIAMQYKHKNIIDRLKK